MPCAGVLPASACAWVARSVNTRRRHSITCAAPAMSRDAPAMASSCAPSRAWVYAGEGASSRSVLSAVEALESSTALQVATLSTADLLSGDWARGAALLVMPGGADLPYCRRLNGAGNALVRAFVEAGGAYLGLCAGAYYACASISFEPGTTLEVCGPRELGFFPGVGVGSVAPGFDYETEAGAVALELRFGRPGGSVDDGTDEAQVCVDYVNGGPAFVPRVDGNGARAGGEGAAALQAAYPGVRVLATYGREPGGRAAAVRCQVGRGVAVLCGSHPELAPHWLGGACSAKLLRATGLARSEERAQALARHALGVKAALQAGAAERSRFWALLLAEAGVAVRGEAAGAGATP